jgi:regulator of protease activity HflC (stomatin/prohibitin superfamily)
MIWIISVGEVVLVLFIYGLCGLYTVRPIERVLVERFGKFKGFALPGLHWKIPFIDRLVFVNITECMVNASKQVVITKDSLNAQVDAQVYYKVDSNEEAVKASIYSVNDYAKQIVSLARTTLRNIIGTLTLKEANSERSKINTALYETLSKEVKNWGIDIVRTELQEIDPPDDVQQTMNKVVKAENEKIAAKDLAEAVETQADGQRRAIIKEAEGEKTASILRAEGQAKSIVLVNEAAESTFKDKAQLLRKLEALERVLATNTKIVLPQGQSLINVIDSFTK